MPEVFIVDYGGDTMSSCDVVSSLEKGIALIQQHAIESYGDASTTVKVVVETDSQVLVQVEDWGDEYTIWKKVIL